MKHEAAQSFVEIHLPFKAPLAWSRLLAFIGGRASAGVESAEDGVYRRAIGWNGAEGTVAVRQHPRRYCLVATIEGALGAHAGELAAPLARMFDLHAEPRKIAAHLSADPWLAPLIERTPGLRVPGAWSGFELVVRTIVGQQVSVKGASTIMSRIVQRAGKRIEGHPDEATAWRFPTPAELALANLDKIGMPTRRIATVLHFAEAVASGALPLDDPNADPLKLQRDMLAMPGIGPWTVGYVAMRALRDADAWPEADLVLMQAIRQRDPALVNAVQQRARTDLWRPYRAYAALHLWNGIALQSGKAKGG
jgi:DNA-3-methyladenine glycosylase II